MAASRSVRFDLLKAFAILAVIFYHLGLQEYGYLGVDVFLVVGGYFLGRSLLRASEGRKFSFFSFLVQRVLRLWPLILLAAAVSLGLGFFLMLPDDYENLAQSAIASSFFANNILSAITTKNYWDVVNDFKPLMHTWYVGVLVQSYVVFALLAKLSCVLTKKPRKYCTMGFVLIFICSLVIYLLPVLKEHEKFYYIPARLFELALGAIFAAFAPTLKEKRIALLKNRRLLLMLELLLLGGIVFLLVFPGAILSASLRLLAVTVATALLILLFTQDDRDWDLPVLKQLAWLGRASYSFFIWHQVVIAFVKYAWCARLHFFHVLICLGLTFLLSAFSYFFVEIRMERVLKDRAKGRRCLVLCVVFSLLISACGLVVVRRAGVVRDVPELGIDADHISANMHATYCDRVYAYDREFSGEGKLRVLVLGNSFGRDFGNILLESAYAEEIELSYSPNAESAGAKRLKEADVIFYTVYGNQFRQLPTALSRAGTVEKVRLIGYKNYGDNNGNIYNRRHRSDYFESSISLTEDYFLQNDRLRQEYGEAYIDMLTPVRKADGTIRVFTAEGKFISQDCRHLTSFGAAYYAELLDLALLLGLPQ